MYKIFIVTFLFSFFSLFAADKSPPGRPDDEKGSLIVKGVFLGEKLPVGSDDKTFKRFKHISPLISKMASVDASDLIHVGINRDNFFSSIKLLQFVGNVPRDQAAAFFFY